jgi:hypothetical protein
VCVCVCVCVCYTGSTQDCLNLTAAEWTPSHLSPPSSARCKIPLWMLSGCRELTNASDRYCMDLPIGSWGSVFAWIPPPRGATWPPCKTDLAGPPCGSNTLQQVVFAGIWVGFLSLLHSPLPFSPLSLFKAKLSTWVLPWAQWLLGFDLEAKCPITGKHGIQLAD